MSRIRGKNTSPEMAVRRLLHRMGYRFRLHVRIAIPPEGARESHESTRKGKLANHAKSSHGHAEFKKDLNGRQRRKQRSGGSFSLPSRPLRSSVKIAARNRLIRSVCPDIVLPKYKTVIFVHGCFWHRHRGCRNCTTPTNRREWWLAKLEGNAVRDTLHRKALRKLGWRSIVIWECHTQSPNKLHYVAESLLQDMLRPNV
jgi:DNA mismatch endonuclease Vsr